MGNICARDENEIAEDNQHNPNPGMKPANALPERREHIAGSGIDAGAGFSPTQPLGRSILEQSSIATDWEPAPVVNKAHPTVQRVLDMRRLRNVRDFPELKDHYGTPSCILKNSRNQDTYQGQAVRGVPEGWGVVYASTGEVVEGLFKEGQPHSHIRYYYSDGSLYEGDFKNKNFDGRGTHFKPDGSSIKCDTWVQGRVTGAYEERDTRGNLVFRGLKGPDGKPQGNCLVATSDATVEGTFQNGVPSGQMTKRYHNSQTYQGTLSLNYQEEGQGHVTFVDGRQYKGPFVKGVPHGEGILVTDAGKELKLKWLNGKRA